MKQRCIWTNTQDENLKEVRLSVPDRLGMGSREESFYVLPEYEDQLRRFVTYFRRYGLFFIIAITILTVASIVAGVLLSPIGSAASVALIGLLLVVFPFSTPETVRMMGLKRSIIVARALGALLFLIAAALPFVL